MPAHIGSVADGIAASVLVVDDTPTNIIILEKILTRQGYSVLKAASGADALKIAAEGIPDLILLDIMMPEINGFEVCRRLASAESTKSIPVIFLTAAQDAALLKEGFEAGGADYLTKPFQVEELLARVRVQIENRRLRHNLEREVAIRTRQLSEALNRIEIAHLEILNRLSQAAEFRDNETANHLKRMGHYSVIIGKTAGLDNDRLGMLSAASAMHDLGKIGIPDSILLKPGKLTPEEFAVMKKHPAIGAELLKDIDSPLMEMATTIALTHHEKFDGSGYPAGLSGQNIPLEGRIVALADVFDALTSARPYKRAWSVTEAMEYIEGGAGKHFDPALVECMKSALGEIVKIQQQFKD